MGKHLETIRGVFDRFAQGDFAASVDLFDPSVVLVVDDAIPEGGVYIGPAGVRDYMKSRLLDSWDSFTIAATGLEQAGDTVLAAVTQRGVGRGSGVPSQIDYFQLWTFRGKRVVHVEVILSEDTAREALKN